MIGKMLVAMGGLAGLIAGTLPQNASRPKLPPPTPAAVLPKSISLNGALECPEDSVVAKVFKTDLATMRKLNPLDLIFSDVYEKTDDDSMNLRRAGFVAKPSKRNDLEFLISLATFTEPFDTKSRGFCADALYSAHYRTDEDSALPISVEIDGGDWLLNSNEVFLHADQFTFLSGVFTDSSDVYLIAQKGRVEVQFIPERSGLKFYRLLIARPE